MCVGTRHSITCRSMVVAWRIPAGKDTNGTLLRQRVVSLLQNMSSPTQRPYCWGSHSSRKLHRFRVQAEMRIVPGTGETVISASDSTSINQSLAYARSRIWSACRNGETAMHTTSVVRRGTRRSTLGLLRVLTLHEKKCCRSPL